MTPFIIYGLPRSRTFWLSRFLTFRDYECGHDQARYLRSFADVKAWLSQDFVGTVETAAACWWKLAQKLRPDMRVAVVRRPVEDVIDSILRIDMRGVCSFDRDGLAGSLRRYDAALNRIEAECRNVMSVQFADLKREAVCANVFEHCLPYDHDPAHWRALSALNLQTSMPAQMRYIAANRPQLTRLGRECVRHYRDLLGGRSNSEPEDLAEVSVAEESFEQFWRDGQRLFAQHAVEVDVEWSNAARPNVELVRKLESLGAAQIMVARYRGEMVGYLATVIGPSLHNEHMTSAAQNTFFVQRRFRGVGPRLQRESLRRLKTQGVHEVIFRAGVRGGGPRMGALYRRLGAEPSGSEYRLMLNGGG